MSKKIVTATIPDKEDKLGLTPEQVSELLAKANQAAAVTDEFSKVSGGLTTGVIIELHNAEPDPAAPQPPTTAGLSGIQNDPTATLPDGYMPAFWAGGMYAQAIGGTAKAIIRHDGSSKFTDAEIEGSIVTKSGNDKITLNENNDNQLKFRHSNGTVAAMFGMSNGEPALIWYDSNGNEVWRAGEAGIVYVEGLEVVGDAEYIGGAVEYSISFTNNTSSSKTITNIELLVRYADNDINDETDPLEPFETIISLGTTTIAAHQTVPFSTQVIGILPDLPTRGGYIYLKYKNPANKYMYINIAYS